MGKRKSLSYQIRAELSKACCYGRSKHEDKKAANDFHPHGIYSVKTYENYAAQCVRFGDWCKAVHGCRTLDQCKEHINEYLDHYGAGKSPSSIHTAKYAIQKLYDISDHGFKVEYTHAKRERAGITKNRSPIESVKDFSEARHADLLAFGKACGLRRHELLNLRFRDIAPDGSAVTVLTGKGGKRRTVPVLEQDRAVILQKLAAAPDPDAHVFQKKDIPSRMPEHRCRREYAQKLYKAYARDPAYLPPADRYICRKDKRGVTYDRKAMLIASQALGHGRLDVIANNYL